MTQDEIASVIERAEAKRVELVHEAKPSATKGTRQDHCDTAARCICARLFETVANSRSCRELLGVATLRDRASCRGHAWPDVEKATMAFFCDLLRGAPGLGSCEPGACASAARGSSDPAHGSHVSPCVTRVATAARRSMKRTFGSAAREQLRKM